MEKVMVAAVARNRVIARGNQMLWHMPDDIAFFRKTIAGTFLLVGRTSYEAPQGQDIYRDRGHFVVITRRKDYTVSHGQVAHSIEEGFRVAERSGLDILSILGGGKIYAQCMPFADRLVITEIHQGFEGDVFFPEIEEDIWQEIRREEHDADAANPYPYAFVEYVRKKSTNLSKSRVH